MGLLLRIGSQIPFQHRPGPVAGGANNERPDVPGQITGKISRGMDARAKLIYTDGRKVKKEFNYGSGYLSQSTRNLGVNEQVKEIIIYDYSGRSRKISPPFH
jgi:hypothetical protein